MSNVIVPRKVDAEEQARVIRHALLAGPVRALGLLKYDETGRATGGRLVELLKFRGWPVEQDLVCVLAAAIGLRKILAGKTVLRRPAAAEHLGGKWPFEKHKLPASMIVDMLELTGLLELP